MNKCYTDLLEPYQGGQYKKYLEKIYEIYKQDLLENENLRLKNKPVKLRYTPMYKGKEESYYHLTHRKYNKDTYRLPDFKRYERIRWIRKIIENVGNCDDCPIVGNSCNGILIWIEPYKDNKRIHFYLEEENFLLVIEKRENYYLIISSFYIDYDKKNYFINKFEKFEATFDEI